MKKVTMIFVLTFLILSLCSCTGIAEQETVGTSSPKLTATLSVASESTNKNREDSGKRVPLKENFVNTLSGAVDYMRYISDSEVLFEIWESDEKDHLYVYNAQSGEMSDTQKTVNGILNCNGDNLWTLEKAAMGENFTVKQLDENFNAISSYSYSDISVKMSRYAISDSGTKVITSDGYKTEDNITVIITDLKTKEQNKLQFSKDMGYRAENVCCLTEDNFIFQCEYTDGKGKMRAFCLSDFDGNVISKYTCKQERVFKNYDNFILIYNQSEIVPSTYGDCVLMNKATGKIKTVEFKNEIGEGQDVVASSDGKYVMTKCMSNDSGKVNHRIYDVDTGKIGCSFELDYAQFGSNYIFIDDINDMVYSFRYDIESNRKEMKLYEIGETNDRN